jgi:hypothetical protein
MLNIQLIHVLYIKTCEIRTPLGQAKMVPILNVSKRKTTTTNKERKTHNKKKQTKMLGTRKGVFNLTELNFPGSLVPQGF